MLDAPFHFMFVRLALSFGASQRGRAKWIGAESLATQKIIQVPDRPANRKGSFQYELTR